MPETSIVIRTFNEEKHIGNLLRAIKEQDYKNYEVIVVDSSSTDRTAEIAKELGAKVIVIEGRDFTFGYALNIGCEASKGKYLVFASAHVLPVDNKWLSYLTSAFQDKKVAMVYGRQAGNSQSKFSEKQDFMRIFRDTPANSSMSLDYANNANSAIRKELWNSHRFDEYLFGLEDIDWARRVSKMGHLIRYEPQAAIYHIHTEAWHQVFNRYRREAIAAYRIGLKHPPQVRLEAWWFLSRLVQDLVTSFPHWSLKRLEEIFRFRYYQWKGSRQGWFRDKGVDLERDKQELFRSDANQVVLIKDKHKAELTKIPLSEMRPGDLLIKVNYVGICRTDLEIYEGSLGYYRDGVANYPIVPGHEFSGTIVKIGANNKYRERYKIGDTIVGHCILSRGENGDRKEVGVINYNGAYAEYIIMPGDAVRKVPQGMDLRIAAMAEPLAVVLRALRRVSDRLPGSRKVAVVGAGPIGNLCSQVLSGRGHKVTVFDKNEERLKILKNYTERTSSALNGLKNFDCIVEATGSKSVLEQILEESRLDSTLLLLGFPYGKINYNFENLVGQEKVFAGSVGGDPEDFDEALKLLPQLNMKPFIERVLPLSEFKEAWELHNSSRHLKVLLKP